MIDVNNPDDLPSQEWLDNPPPWFVYFVKRLAAVAPGEVDDAIEKISPHGSLPEWHRES